MKHAILFLLLLASASANAQFTPGQILTAQELNNQFALYLPYSGGTLTGPLTAPSLTLQGVSVLPNLSGTTGSIGGSSLAAGACSTGTVSIAGATTSMAVVATPATYPGASFYWHGYVSSSNTVTVAICAAAAGTPTSSTYNVRVAQ